MTEAVAALIWNKDKFMIRWITVGEIDQYEFCPVDEVVLDKLRHEYMKV